MVALGGVVVDDVEDHLDPGLVQRPDHRLELGDLLAALAGRGVLVMRREEADRVVAPVVPQPPVDQLRIVDELVHGQQFDRGDAEAGEVLDRGRVAEPGVGAALRLRDLRMLCGEALDVHLVDDRLVQRDVGRPVVAPVEVRVVHDGSGHVRRRCRRRCASSRRRRCTGSRPGSSRPGPRWPSRTGRAAAWPGCSGGPARVPTGRAPGSRSAARAPRSAGRRASRRRRSPPARSAPRGRRRRTGRARPARRPRRTARSSCRPRRRRPRADRADPARSRWPHP